MITSTSRARVHAVVLFALASLAGCGAPSAADVCKRGCDKTITCTGGTSTAITQCQTNCDQSSVSNQYASCKNAGDILSCVNGCLGVADCNDSAKCVSGCPKCVTDGTGPGPGGGDGGTGGATDLSSGGFCTEFCNKLQSCFPGATTDGGSCLSQCASQVGTNCSNRDAITACYQACDAQDCQRYPGCVQACPRCQ